MSIRVISGAARGTKLKLVPGDSTRPIMDRVKESLFNILGRSVLDSSFLDLFAGTGSVAIEALSRGAKHALLLDIETKAIRTIHENLRLTHLEDRAVVRKQDAFALLQSRAEKSFDFVYIAPPQYQKMWRTALLMLDANPMWVAEEGMVIIQIDPTEQETLTLTNFHIVDERRYGSTLLCFFEHKHPESPTMLEPSGSPEKLKQLELVVDELIQKFAITAPPVPLERMLQEPRPGMWSEIDIREISVGFLKVTSPFSPRMSLARFLARLILTHGWGQARGLPPLDDQEIEFHQFARMIVMPAKMIRELSEESRTPALMSAHFEVPEEDAHRRLEDLRTYTA